MTSTTNLFKTTTDFLMKSILVKNKANFRTCSSDITTRIKTSVKVPKSDEFLCAETTITKNQMMNVCHICRRHASHSSASWVARQEKDIYVKKKRYDNYRARSAYKLIQLDDQFKFLAPGKVIIEAGAAPGSWTQVICERLKLTDRDNKLAQKGMCMAIDIAAIQPVEGAICLGNADFTSPFTQAKLLTWLNDRKADCVLSDMAPSATGQKYLNHTRVLNLIESLLPFAFQVLKPGGVFLFKLWDGQERVSLVAKMKNCFRTVKIVKPDASRGDSAEIYVFCSDFKGEEKRETERTS